MKTRRRFRIAACASSPGASRPGSTCSRTNVIRASRATTRPASSARLAQQDQLRNGIGRRPEDGVLLELTAERLRGRARQTQHQKARLAGPFAARVLANAITRHAPLSCYLPRQCRLTLGVA